MRSWLLLLAGPLVWAAHFLSLYGIASIAALQSEAPIEQRQSAIVIATIIALAIAGLALAFLYRRDSDDLSAFRKTVSLTGITLSAIAILWQSLPALWL